MGQGVTARVTVLLLDATTPAAAVALSVYVMVRFDANDELVTLVTTVCGVVVNVTVPTLVAPVGATSETVSVTPAGSALVIDAVICFVVPDATFTRYRPVDVETVVGAAPATAELMISDPAAPWNCTASCENAEWAPATINTMERETARR